MTDEIITPDKASFNQAQYQQIRINEIILRIDRLNTNPLLHNPAFFDYNYKIIFNDLCSLLQTISAKLTLDEKKEMGKKKEAIESTLIDNPPFRQMQDPVTFKKGMGFCAKSWRTINNLFYDFRIRLEELMDIHGFGNPTKDDPRKSVFKGI